MKDPTIVQEHPVLDLDEAAELAGAGSCQETQEEMNKAKALRKLDRVRRAEGHPYYKV